MSTRHTRRDFLAAAHTAQALAAGLTTPRPQTQRDARSWFRITNMTSSDEAELLLYDEIGGWGTYADEFVAALKGVTAPSLRVRVNSPGGSVFEGIAVANALRNHPAQVTVQVDGIAASIASVIAMAGDRLVMAPNSTLMIHDASGVCMGNAGDMHEMADLLDLLSNNIADVYASKAGGTREEWRARMQAESWYLAQDAVDAGLADEVAAPPRPGAGEPEMRQAFDLTAYGYTGPKPAEEQPAPVTVRLDCAGLGEQLVAALRAVARTPEPEEPAVEEQAEEGPRCAVCLVPIAEHEGFHDRESWADLTTLAHAEQQAADTPPVEPLPEPEPQHDHPADLTWADLVAHLTQPEPDPWAALVAHLTTTPASSSAATEAA